jgi:hypothetical protein
MGTRVRVTYLAVDVDGDKPIMSAHTFKDLRAGLDDYYGCDGRRGRGGECLGFTPYYTKYPDEYEGYYKYKVMTNLTDPQTEYIDTVKVYCIDFYPHTIYEINEEIE